MTRRVEVEEYFKTVRLYEQVLFQEVMNFVDVGAEMGILN